VRRGEIWWVDFGIPIGSEAGHRRPAVVVQADPLNRSQIGTVLLVPLTRTLKWEAAPGNVSCRARDTGLRHRSVANVSQLTAIDRRRVREKAGQLPGALMARLDEGLKLVLGLS
jgi:mRNA interferase MazF